MKKKSIRFIYLTLIILSIVGFGFATYQTIEHYFLTTSICDFTEGFSCSSVTESTYGELPYNSGVALSLYGMIWWAGLIWLANRGRKGLTDMINDFYIFLWLLAGVVFSLYLIFVEVYLLPLDIGQVIICPFCTVQHTLIGILFIMSIFLLEHPLRTYINSLSPAFYFFIGTLAIISIGGYFILSPSQQYIEHYDFTSCLASKNATMYGFDACPNCQKQKYLLGKKAFQHDIEDAGLYVKCRPQEEAMQPIGSRLEKISIIPQYEGTLDPTITQGALCAKMVGRGTPTWIINRQQRSGWLTVPELAALSGCPLPETVTVVQKGRQRFTEVENG